uniref:Uncharacterized protein n=1 Tax=Alcaligenes faecalis TaxID=511 RepID=Q6WB68_ALCFA|nr:hypothetical protein [Alcaligenes faecalis subsp. faecalis NCIB 8687]
MHLLCGGLCSQWRQGTAASWSVRTAGQAQEGAAPGCKAVCGLLPLSSARLRRHRLITGAALIPECRPPGSFPYSTSRKRSVLSLWISPVLLLPRCRAGSHAVACRRRQGVIFIDCLLLKSVNE